MPGAMEGVRIVDLTQQLSGPYASMLLADMGAEVVKVEPPNGEDMRRSPPFVNGESAAFMMWNRNKRGIALDLKDEVDHALLIHLIASADILLENFSPGVMDRLGLGWDLLHVRFPRLIYGSISGFGQTGPAAERKGFDVIAQGASGLMSITGERDGGPHRLPIPLCDLASGMFLAIGVLGALESRHRTGLGQRVETSLLESAVALQVYEAAHFFTHGTNPPRMGQGHRGGSPYQVFASADGHVTICAAPQRLFEKFCHHVGLSPLLEDPRFATQHDRVAHSDELVAIVGEVIATRPTAWWVEQLEPLGIPCGPVLTHSELFADPQIVHRAMVETVVHPVAGEVRTLGSPIKFSDGASALRHPAPTLGQHDHEIRAEARERTRSAAGKNEGRAT